MDFRDPAAAFYGIDIIERMGRCAAWLILTYEPFRRLDVAPIPGLKALQGSNFR